MYYEKSGRYSIKGASIVTVSVLMTAIIVGYLYASICGEIYIFSLLCGALMGVSIWGFNRIGKIRNDKILNYISLFAGFSMWYCQWVFWIEEKSYLTDNRCYDGLFDLFFSPFCLLKEILGMVDEGTWKITMPSRISEVNQRRWNNADYVTGPLLFLFWILEAIILLWIPKLGVFFSKPFCEDSDKWAKEKKMPIPLNYIEDKDNFINSLEKQDYSILLKMKPSKSKIMYSEFTFYHCNQNSYFLKVENIKKKKYKKNSTKIDSTSEVVKFIKIQSIVAQRFILSLERLNELMENKR